MVSLSKTSVQRRSRHPTNSWLASKRKCMDYIFIVGDMSGRLGLLFLSSLEFSTAMGFRTQICPYFDLLAWALNLLNSLVQLTLYRGNYMDPNLHHLPANGVWRIHANFVVSRMRECYVSGWHNGYLLQFIVDEPGKCYFGTSSYCNFKSHGFLGYQRLTRWHRYRSKRDYFIYSDRKCVGFGNKDISYPNRESQIPDSLKRMPNMSYMRSRGWWTISKVPFVLDLSICGTQKRSETSDCSIIFHPRYVL